MWISKKKMLEIQDGLTKLRDFLEKVDDLAFLVSVERENGKNYFTFIRGNKKITIQTASLISDNLPAWKDLLLR